jgi:hypothetical protein
MTKKGYKQTEGHKKLRCKNRINVPEKLWEKIKVKSKDECWEWVGSLYPGGYGIIKINCKNYRTHRLAYELTYGPILNNLHVLHKCDNKKCCNPNHLFLGTHKDNMKDRDLKGRNGDIKGMKNPNHKLTIEQIYEIKRLYNSKKYTQRELGKLFGTHYNNIWKIINNKSWNGN